MNHTPGPWEVSCDLHGLVYVEPSGRPAETVICDVIARAGHGDVDDEARANASLIAAAPDLLTAAEAALKILRDHGISDGNMSDLDGTGTRGLLRAAIAKARGEEE